MSLSTKVSFVVAVVVAAIGSQSVASAAWMPVSSTGGGNQDEMAMVRGGDRVLHLAYVEQQSSQDTLRYRTLSANGRTLTPPMAINGPWISMTNPDLELAGGTLHAFWGGQGTLDSGDPTRDGRAWYATLAGGTWTRSSEPLTFRASPYASSQVSSAVASDGTPWVTWTGTGLLAVHSGLAMGVADEVNYSTGCCEYAANISRDAATGDLYLVWYSNITNGQGVYSKRITPVAGDTIRMPSTASTASSLGRTKRLAAASRTTGGVFSAYCDTYPTCNRLRVAEAGGRSLTLRIPGGQTANSEDVWTASAPGGRMWLAWSKGTLDDSPIYAVRSNRAFTRWGAIQRLEPINRAGQTVWSISGEGSTGHLDLFANATVGSATRQYYHRVLPGLSLQQVSNRVNQRQGVRIVTFRVTDAGDAVALATVRFQRHSARSNARGFVTIRTSIPTQGPRMGVAVATKSGYAAARRSARVR